MMQFVVIWKQPSVETQLQPIEPMDRPSVVERAERRAGDERFQGRANFRERGVVRQPDLENLARLPTARLSKTRRGRLGGAGVGGFHVANFRCGAHPEQPKGAQLCHDVVGVEQPNLGSQTKGGMQFVLYCGLR